MSKWFHFSVVYELGQHMPKSLVAQKMIQIHCTYADVDISPVHSPSVRTLVKH